MAKAGKADRRPPEMQPLKTTAFTFDTYQSTCKPPRTAKLECPGLEDQEKGLAVEVAMPTGHLLIHDGQVIHQLDPSRIVNKIVTYNPEVALGWEALWSLSQSVFTKPIIVQTLVQSAIIFACTATLTCVLPTGPTLHTTQLNYLVNFMMVFLAFITGIFVNGSFQRWQALVTQLGMLFRGIKGLHNDLEALGCPPDVRRRIKRWGILSVWLVAYEAQENWERSNWKEQFGMIKSYGYITDVEEQFLETTGAKSSIPWNWCTMMVKEMADQGNIPPVGGPAYCMLLGNIDMAELAIQTIDQLCLLQMPYMYVHMLAWLIHAFNIVNAIRCGMEVGIVLAQIRTQDSQVPTAQQIQGLFTYTVIMMLAPTIYQAFLTIALDIAIPFGNGDTDLPIVYLIDKFASELNDLEETDVILNQYRKNARRPPTPSSRPQPDDASLSQSASASGASLPLHEKGRQFTPS